MRDWKADVSINPNSLDIEWCKQASTFCEYGMEQAQARRTDDQLKEALEVVAAKLDQKIRRNPASYGMEKLTEAGVKAAVLLDPEYAEAVRKFQDAQFELEVMGVAVRGMDQKKAALENLVRLQGQSYFAGPSTPRDLNGEWAKELSHQAAAGKVKAGRTISRV